MKKELNIFKVDLFSASLLECSVTVNEHVLNSSLTHFIEDFDELDIGSVDLTDNRAVVSCIGEQMKGVRGLAAQMFGVLVI